MLSALGQCGRDSGVALGLPECPGLVVWGPVLKGEREKKKTCGGYKRPQHNP